MKSLLIILLVLSIIAVGVGQQQQPTLVYVKQIDDHSHLITIAGVQFLASDLDRVKEYKSNEINLAEARITVAKLEDSLSRSQRDLSLREADLSDTKVILGKNQKMLGEHLALEKQCFDLLKKGGGKFNSFLDNPWIKLTRDIAPNAIQMAVCK